jgi:hypothetical protein
MDARLSPSGMTVKKRESANIIWRQLITKKVCISEHQADPVTIVRLRVDLLDPPDRKYSLKIGQNALRNGDVLPRGDRLFEVDANARDAYIKREALYLLART